MEDTFNRRQPLMERDLLIGNDLCWNTTFNRRHPVMNRNSITHWVGRKRVKGLFKPFFAKAIRSKTRQRRDWSLTLKTTTCILLYSDKFRNSFLSKELGKKSYSVKGIGTVGNKIWYLVSFFGIPILCQVG